VAVVEGVVSADQVSSCEMVLALYIMKSTVTWKDVVDKNSGSLHLNKDCAVMQSFVVNGEDCNKNQTETDDTK